MSDWFEMDEKLKSGPSLSFDTPDDSPAAVAAADVNEALVKEEDRLTEEERRMVDSFSEKIDLSNSAAIMNYGAGTQKKMADFSDKAIGNIRSKDIGAVGDMLSGLIVELKSMDAAEEEKGLRGLFKKGGNRLNAMKAKYAKVEDNVDGISRELERHQVTLMKDIDVLDKMYALNLTYFKELTMYILAGRKKLDQVRAGELAQLQKKAAESGLMEDAQAAEDLASKCDRFEKKLHDLDLTRIIALQTGPQIRMVQSSDTMMVEKIQSTIVNTIPLWKNQMVIALGVHHAEQAARAEREVNNMTNALLKKNAETLKSATVASAREAERGIVDMETLKHTNELLISTLDEVLVIQKEGKEKRAAAREELGQIEERLRRKLLEAATR